ncbi:hypothetical protein D623_10024853 [Myotis brandtii]|uniref:Uncharacterized protein n=1 Tax=Myotis brandtii TaxID=109478 RepID=S7NHM0_MYOBR|nr:hypothetical protein D623_10024853 [Myotis brandtii]
MQTAACGHRASGDLPPARDSVSEQRQADPVLSTWLTLSPRPPLKARKLLDGVMKLSKSHGGPALPGSHPLCLPALQPQNTFSNTKH